MGPFRVHILATLAAAILAAPIATSSSRTLRECAAGEGDPEYLRARAEWYLEAFGHRGVLDPERTLRLTRETYEARRATHRLPMAAFEGGAFRFLGPTNGAGRTPAVELHPTDPDTLYAGAAGGGCWKSTDRGLTWRSLTDDLPNLSVGAVAIAPSNPSIVYLGTGEGGYAGDFIPGIGVLRSTDGGESWRLPDSVFAPMIYKLSVDPRNPDVVVAFAYQGAYRSTNGGQSFTRTSDGSWGDAADLVRDPTNPDVLHGTFWSLGGTERGRYARSTNGGNSWTEVRTGLPGDPKGRMSIGISSDGQTLYTLVSGPFSDRVTVGLYRTTNAGLTWTKAAMLDPASARSPDILSGQGSYDNCVAVDPDDSRTLLLGGGAQGQWRSTNGGETVADVGRRDDVHVDIHQLVFKRYGSLKVAWSANDGGLWVSTDGGVRWQARNDGLATRQYYSMAVDSTRPDVFYAGSQDNGTDRRGADSGAFDIATGGDGFETAVDPLSPATVYTTSQYATLFRTTRDGDPSSFAHISQGLAGRAYSSSGGDGTKPFFTRVLLDPRDPRTVYTGTWRVWRSQDRGESWTPLDSRLFSRDDTIRGLAVSGSRILAAQRQQLFLSNDGGATFAALPGFVSGTPVYNVEIDPSDPDTFFVTAASTSVNRTGSVYRSRNAGASFERVGSGLPEVSAWVVRVDPGDSRVVYAGTLVGLYRSTDGGATFARHGEGLPAVAVMDVRVSSDGARLAVATHGRGIWQSIAASANQPPRASIVSPPGPLSLRPGDSVTFAGAAEDPDGDAVTVYRWDFGEGRLGDGAAPAPVTYRMPGVYRVSLVAEDARGARGAAVVDVTVLPPNDGCDDALPIALVPGEPVILRTGNGGALDLDAADPATCSQPEISSSVWFRFTPPSDGTLTLDSYGSLGDTVLALYGGPCEAPGAALTCNDDAPDVSGGASDLLPQSVTGGRTYRLLAATWADRDAGYEGPVDSIRVNALFEPAAQGDSPGTSAVLPVALDAFGRNGARFVSDLTLLNRGAAPLTAALTWGGASSNVKTTSVTLAPGEQLRAPDALEELRRLGIAVPQTTATSSQVGSLTALVTGGDAAGLVLASRTASPNPVAAVGGSFGIFTAGARLAETADSEAVYVFGLRQTDRDRANLALVHVRTPRPSAQASAPITLQVEVFDASGAAAPGSPLTARLAPGEWTQIGEVLAQAGLATGAADGGYARVRRTEGSGRFLAYGVVNDQRTADGSLIPMVRAGELTAGSELLVPIVLSVRGLAGSYFTSELALASRSGAGATVTLRYAASPLLGGAGSGSVTLPLPAGAQRVISDVIGYLRTNGLAIPEDGPQGGALFVSFAGLAAGDDVYAGVRTSTPNPDTSQGGSFGVFAAAVAPSGLATASAVVPALRQDAAGRSNLAVVNGGGSPVTLSVVLRGTDGSSLGAPLTRTLQAGEWYQWSNVFAQAGAGEGEGWAVVTRTSGGAPWLAYGVLNDARTSDGSVVSMVR